MEESLIKRLNKKNIIMQIVTGAVIIFVVAASLAAIMTGYGTNLKNFLGVEVFDFSQDELTKSSDTWFYDGANQYFILQKKISTHKYNLNKKMQAWKCLCVTIDKMSAASTEAVIVYYDKAGNIITEQPVTFNLGENTIALYGDIEMYRMGIRMKAEPGSIVSISVMQLRSELYAMDKAAFVRIFALFSSVGIILVFFIIFKRNKKEKSKINFFIKLFCALNIEIQTCMSDRRKRSIRQEDRSTWRRIIFSVLFVWTIWGDFSGIATDKDYYPWFAIVCTGLIIALGVLCIEKRPRNRIWNCPIAAVWTVLWILIIISDITVGEGIKFTGYVMLFAGGFFICCWNQMQKPLYVVHEAIEAMEIDFFIVVLCCIFFRQKRMMAYYHGIFHDAESFTIYSVLMYAVFLTDILGILREKSISKSIWMSITGAAVSLFMAIRSGMMVTYIVIVVVSVLYAVNYVKTMWKRCIVEKDWRLKEMGVLIAAAGLALLVASGVHMAIKCVPEKLGTNITLENETWISSLSTGELNLYQQAFPEMFDNMSSWDTLNIQTNQKNYLRRLGLTGNIDTVKAYGKTVQAYNGYLEMAYRYGTLTIIPFILFQIYSVKESVRRKKIFLLSLNLIYVCFCIFGNMGIQLQHPIVWCVYLLNGYFFLTEEGMK